MAAQVSLSQRLFHNLLLGAAAAAAATAATQLLSATVSAKLYKDPLQPRLASHLRVTRRAANQAPRDHEGICCVLLGTRFAIHKAGGEGAIM